MSNVYPKGSLSVFKMYFLTILIELSVLTIKNVF